MHDLSHHMLPWRALLHTPLLLPCKPGTESPDVRSKRMPTIPGLHGKSKKRPQISASGWRKLCLLELPKRSPVDTFLSTDKLARGPACLSAACRVPSMRVALHRAGRVKALRCASTSSPTHFPFSSQRGLDPACSTGYLTRRGSLLLIYHAY
jgi:hypothetical protein